ncbi:MAG: RNA polymerase sigma factor [Desulfomonilaceae bacterium]
MLRGLFLARTIYDEVSVLDMGTRDLSSDGVLVKQCVSGSERAWTQFYRQHHGLIEAVVKRHTPSSSPDVREDLAQEVYQSLVTALETYDTRLSSLRTFVSMVAARTCIDWLRGQSRMSRKGINEPVDHHGDPEQGAVVLQSGCDPPDEQVAKAEHSNMIRSALNRLTETCRELLKLRYYFDLTYPEIAARLGKQENTVNVQILRCQARLKTAYDDLENEGLRT